MFRAFLFVNNNDDKGLMLNVADFEHRVHKGTKELTAVQFSIKDNYNQRTPSMNEIVYHEINNNYVFFDVVTCKNIIETSTVLKHVSYKPCTENKMCLVNLEVFNYLKNFSKI